MNQSQEPSVTFFRMNQIRPRRPDLPFKHYSQQPRHGKRYVQQPRYVRPQYVQQPRYVQPQPKPMQQPNPGTSLAANLWILCHHLMSISMTTRSVCL